MNAEKIGGKKNRGYWLLAWALIGCVIIFITCSVSLSGKFSIRNPFYNCGEVEEISTNQFLHDYTGKKGHMEADGTIVLDQGLFAYGIVVKGYNNNWNYLYVNLDNLTSDSVQWDIIYRDKNDDEVVDKQQEVYQLTNGMNQIVLPENVSFNNLEVRMTGENGTSFMIKEIQFREKPPIFNTATVIRIGILTLLLFVAFSVLLYFIYKKLKDRIKIHVYSCIEILQEFYLSLMKRLKGLLHQFPVFSKYKSVLRRILFFLMLCFSMFVDVEGIYYSRFKYNIIVYIVLLLAITALSVEDHTSKKDWNNPLVWSWIVLCVMMCISDFIVQKDVDYYRFIGYAMLLVIGLFIFVWNNMAHAEEMLTDFIKAVQAFFWFAIVFCFLFRPETDADRYAGFSTNAAVTALCLITVWAVVLGELEQAIRSKKKRHVILFYLIEGCIIVSFVWKTQSAGPLICIGLLAIIWFVRMVIYTFRQKEQRTLVLTVTCSLLLVLPVYGIVTIGLNYIPEALGTEIVFDNEVKTEKITISSVVNASDSEENIENSRLERKFSRTTITGILSGRPYYYRLYLRNLNLFGHKDRPEMWGKRRLPHNAVLGMAYSYGIFTIVPYILMLVAVLIGTFKYSKKNVKYAAVPFFVSFAFIFSSLTDNVEQPFVWLPWISMYLLMGSVFSKDRCEDTDEFIDYLN